MPETGQTPVRCLVVPLQGGRSLLLPNAAVAEVVPYRAPENPDPQAPWRLGSVDWRGQQLQVLAFETLCGDPFARPGRGAQLVVLNAIGAQAGTGYYALAASAIPHLLVVAAETLQGGAAPGDGAGSPVLLEARVDDRPVSIPDLEALEARLQETA